MARLDIGQDASYATVDDFPDSVPDAGGWFLGTAWVKAANALSLGKRAMIVVRTRPPPNGFMQLSEPLVADAWQRVEVLAGPLPAGQTVDVYVGRLNAVAGESLWVDAVTLLETGEPDGGQDGGSDRGTGRDGGGGLDPGGAETQRHYAISCGCAAQVKDWGWDWVALLVVGLGFAAFRR